MVQDLEKKENWPWPCWRRVPGQRLDRARPGVGGGLSVPDFLRQTQLLSKGPVPLPPQILHHVAKRRRWPLAFLWTLGCRIPWHFRDYLLTPSSFQEGAVLGIMLFGCMEKDVRSCWRGKRQLKPPQSTTPPPLVGSFMSLACQEEPGGSLERVKRCSACPAAAANSESFSHMQPPNSLTFSILHEKDKGLKIFP